MLVVLHLLLALLGSHAYRSPWLTLRTGWLQRARSSSADAAGPRPSRALGYDGLRRLARPPHRLPSQSFHDQRLLCVLEDKGSTPRTVRPSLPVLAISSALLVAQLARTFSKTSVASALAS